jgi:type I restriction enzyme R subunit
VRGLFEGFNYRRYFGADTQGKLTIILEAEEHILGLEDGKMNLLRQVKALSEAFSLSIPDDEALKIKDEVGFFQAVKSRLVKFEKKGSGRTKFEIETAIRDVVDKAIKSDQVIDIFEAAGIDKPEISILSDEFLSGLKNKKNKNLALELLKKLINDEIQVRSKKNIIQSKKLLEMLESVIKRYQNKLLTAAQVIDELIDIAKEIRFEDERRGKLNLSYEELAFYDALADNESAQEVLGQETLRELAMVLVDRVRNNASIDWEIKENLRARMRVIVKRLLRRYGYPPDKQAIATEQILKQAENYADIWSKEKESSN